MLVDFLTSPGAWATLTQFRLREKKNMDKNTVDAPGAGGAILALPLELDHRLEDCARQEGTTKALLALRAIEQYLEDLEDVADAEAVLEGIAKGEVKVVSFEEMERRLYLEDMEDVADAEQALREFYASGEKAIPIEEVMREYGLQPYDNADE
jgi:RHH-type rel operon transcriptional repressor/antitoxin RelB